MHARRKGRILTQLQRNYLDSKAIRETFHREFIMRRMNTSYTKELTWTKYAHRIRLEEELLLNDRNMFDSVIVLRLHLAYPEATDSSMREAFDIRTGDAVGRSYPDGVIWIHKDLRSLLSRRVYRAIQNVLWCADNFRSDETGTWYKIRSTVRATNSVPIVQQGQSFTQIVQQNWSV